MRKTLGLALALTLGLSLTAAAEETRGTIRSMDTGNHSIVLEDGTRLWISEGQQAVVAPGDYVDAADEAMHGKKLVKTLEKKVGLDGSTDPLLSIQSPGDYLRTPSIAAQGHAGRRRGPVSPATASARSLPTATSCLSSAPRARLPPRAGRPAAGTDRARARVTRRASRSGRRARAWALRRSGSSSPRHRSRPRPCGESTPRSRPSSRAGRRARQPSARPPSCRSTQRPRPGRRAGRPESRRGSRTPTRSRALENPHT